MMTKGSRKKPAIDDPLDQIERHHRDEGSAGTLAKGLSIAGLFLSLGNPAVGALATLTSIAAEITDEKRRKAKADAFRGGIIEKVGDITSQVEELSKKLTGPDAEETLSVAIRHTLAAGRLDKARRFGQIVGGTMAQDPPRWQEASEFIRTLEALGDDDLGALNILWKIQRAASTAMHQKSDGMSTNANDYTGTWKDVLEQSSIEGITPDEWYSRCARLMGFGLALVVESNPLQQKKDAMVFRLTGRAVRLMNLLGRNVNPRAYPSVKYHPDGRSMTVNDEDADKALGPGWFDTPNAFKK